MKFNIVSAKALLGCSRPGERIDGELLRRIREVEPDYSVRSVVCECGATLLFNEKSLSFPSQCTACSEAKAAQETERRKGQLASAIADLRQGFRAGRLPIETVSDPTKVPVLFVDYPWAAVPPALKAALEPFLTQKRLNRMFAGNSGNHKSTTAWALCEEWLARGVGHDQWGNLAWPKIVFVKWTQLLYIASASQSFVDENVHYNGVTTFHPEFACRFIESMAKAELLVIDDVGVGSINTDARASVVYSVIDERLDKGLATLTTTNCSQADLVKLLGERFVSRIKTGGTIHFTGGDDRPGGLTKV